MGVWLRVCVAMWWGRGRARAKARVGVLGQERGLQGRGLGVLSSSLRH